MSIADRWDRVWSAIRGVPSSGERDAAEQRFWDQRRAINEQLVARGFRPCFDPYRPSTDLFAMQDQELEFIRAGQVETFTAKWAYMNPATNIADLWWRTPRMGKQGRPRSQLRTLDAA